MRPIVSETTPEFRLTARPRIGLLACSVFEREIELHAEGATHIAEIQFFEIGLHDRPDNLRTKLQTSLDLLDVRDDIDAVVLVYGLCGCGTTGLEPRRHQLVIPRAHDCITLFMGSKEIYAEHQRSCPGCFYYTPGWNRGKRVPGPEKLAAMKLELSERFDADDVDFLIETERVQWAQHDTAVYLDLGTADAEPEAEYAQNCAKFLGWRFEHWRGDPTLLRDLLWCRWDTERFQIVEPGSRLGHSVDQKILCTEPGARKEV